MKPFIWIVILTSMLVACRNGIKNGTELKIIGKTIQEVNDKYGTSTNTKNISLEKGVKLEDYQMVLSNHIPTKENETLLIIEMNFTQKSEENITVWLTPKDNQLKVIDALQWAEGVAF